MINNKNQYTDFIEKYIDKIDNNQWESFWYCAITDFGYTYELGELIGIFDLCDIDSKPDYIFQHIHDKPITIKWNQTDFTTAEDIAHELNNELYKYRKSFQLKETNTYVVLNKLQSLYLTNFDRRNQYHLENEIQAINLTPSFNIEYQRPVLSISLQQGSNVITVGFQDILERDLIIIPGEGWAYSEAGIKKMIDWFEHQFKNNLRII